MSEASPLLQVEALSVRFGGLMAVEAVSLSVSHGSVVGLIGPNGAGKTTFLDALTGFVRSRGAIRFAGRRIDGLSPHRRARRGLSRTFQSLELFDDLTARENVLTAADPRLGSGLLEPLRGVRPSVEHRVDAALERVGLASSADRLPTELAHADCKLLGVARALANNPRLVLLDEPAAGLDHESTAALGRQLRNLADDGIALLLVDHDMSLVLNVCDRVAVLDLGNLIATGTPAEIRRDAEVIAAYLGEDELAATEAPSAGGAGDP